MKRVDMHAQETEAAAHADAAPFAFVPLPLRHHFHADDVDNQEEHALVQRARQTRSAQLVATLLYNTKGTSTDAATSLVRHKAKKMPAKSPVKSAKPSEAAASSASASSSAASSGPKSLPLYSLAVEQAIAKRMAFTRAVRQLDAYFRDLDATVGALESRSSTGWVWDATIKLPTMLQLQRKVVQSVVGCLPECDVYLAMYEPLPMANPVMATPWPLLRYVAASPQSRMAGHVLQRMPLTPNADETTGTFVSVDVLDSLDPALVSDISGDARVQFVADPTATASIRTGPFACLPLVDACESRGIGVLALDACRKAAHLRPEAMSPQALFEFLTRMQLPEAAVEFRKLQFGGRQLLQLTANDLQHRPAYCTLKIQTKQRVLELIAALRSGYPVHLPRAERPSFFCDDDEALELLDEVCERAGKFLDEYRRRVHWHRVMAKRTNDPKTSVLDVYSVLVHGIAEALVGVERVCVWKIRDCTDIDAIATTHIPDDRLLPFLQWNERQIRRLALYTEDNEAQGQLMQGNITRIHLPTAFQPDNQSNQPNIAQSQSCERALYHVTWSNRTQQSLSWPKLRQLLPIRPMNARHYQLSQLLKRLVEIKADQNDASDGFLRGVQFRLVDPSALVVLLHDPQRPENVVYALQIDFVAHSHQDEAMETKHREDIDKFVRRAADITRLNVLCVRGREARSFRRQLSTVKTSRNFSSLGLTPSPDALRALDEIVSFVFSEISTNLPGTLQQIAELQSDGTQLRFTFAGNGSSLAGKMLARSQGVSFRCVDTRTSVVVKQDSELRSRLKCIGSVADMETELPYVIVPLIHEDACIGILSVNHFVDVPKGRADEVHPEDGVVEYITSLARPLAAAIYLKRRSFALHELHQLRLEPLRSPEQLFLAACKALQDTMTGSWKTRVMEVDFARGKCTSVFDYTEAARSQAETVAATRVVPLGFRVKELMPDTIQQHWRVSDLEVEALVKMCAVYESEVSAAAESAISQLAVVGSSSAVEVQRRKNWEWCVRQRYYSINLKPLEDAELPPTKMAHSSPSKKGELVVGERSTNEKYLAHALSTALSSKTVTYADVPALTIGNSSAVYLIIATLPQFYATCEQHFVDRVATVMSRMMEALVQRVERSRIRVGSLAAVDAECAKFVDQATASIEKTPTKPGGFPLSPSEEVRLEAAVDLLERVVRLVGDTLMCPNVYLALHEPLHRRLSYISASDKSGMKGKVLHRGHGVSFFAFDNHQPIVIKASTTPDEIEQRYGSSSSVRYFSSDPKESQKWPLIVVPIGATGILALDNLQKYEMIASESQPEIGVVDFLRHAGARVADAITIVRARSLQLRRQRREEALVRVMAACENVGKNTSSLYIQHVALQAIESALNGVDAYIAVLQPLSESLIFTSATARSGMANQKVNAVDSVSFRVFVSQRPLMIPQVERKQFDASEQHIAELVSQLRWFVAAQGQGRKGPFVCIPIPFVGVLSVDSFPGAASGVFSSHIPEYGVVAWLNQIANMLGATIRQLSAADAARAIPKLFEGNRSTFRTVFQELLKIIALNVLTAVELCVLTYDIETWQPVHGADVPLVSVTTTISQHKEDLDATIRSSEPSFLQELQAKSSDETRCFMLSSQPEVVVLRLADIRDVEYDEQVHTSTDWLHACPLRKSLLVLRRVRGASWDYDVEFLQSLVSLLDDLVERVNLRVCGIAVRRNALSRLEVLCNALEGHPSSSAAYDRLPRFLDDALCLITQAASQDPGDAYLAERQVGGEVLRYVAASSSSWMRDVEIQLLAPENEHLVVVQSLFDHHKAVIKISESNNIKNDTTPRPLTSTKAQRVFMTLPMSECRVLCVDSLSSEAFDVLQSRVEKDIDAFLGECAALLETTISSVNYRRSYDDLCSLKTARHSNFRSFFTRIHEILRRDLGVLHSQQIVELAPDFTGQFAVRSWHRAATRRPIRGPFKPHFCSVNGCTRDYIALDVHHEQHIALPMTNLPRTLDQSRAIMEPVAGREKQGAYACDCLATMLDSAMKVPPKLALCIFSHDEISSGDKPSVKTHRSTRAVGLPTAFTSRQRQYFSAFGAVVSDVYVDVFRACVLETFSTEALFIARDQLCAKDAVLLCLEKTEGEYAKSVVRVVTGSSMPATKWMPGSQVAVKLAEKVLSFYENAESFEFLIVQTKKAPVSGSKPPLSASPVPVKKPEESTSASSAASSSGGKSFFKRPRLFGAKQTQAKAPKGTPSSATNVTPSMCPPPPKATIEFHILARGYHDGEVLSLHVDREIAECRDAGEQLAIEVRAMLEEMAATRDRFSKDPQGDEEWNGAGFGHELEIGEGIGFGGGGFHVLSCWTLWRNHMQNEIVHFETDMRSYLTGVQATSRDQLGAGVAAVVRPGLLPSQAHSTHPEESMFAQENTANRSAAMVLVRAALLLCGFKKEIAIDSPADEDDNLLKEYLRANAGRKLVDLNPRLTSKLAVALRAGNYIRTKFSVVAAIVASDSQASSSSIRGARALLLFIQSFNSAIKYFKFLQDNAKQRKQRVDATATVIQCFSRCVQAKALLKRLRIEFKAALAIQCAFRQHLARRQRLFLKWNHAAVTVQQAYRRKIARRRGRRPRKLTLELRTVAAQYGTMQSAGISKTTTLDDGDGSWKTEMASFDSFKAYLTSRVGREQLKREEHVITEQLKEVVRQREQLDAHDRLLADAHDVFEILDSDGRGELSREDTRDLMMRLHVPLSREEADDVIDMMDNDHSGAISFAEFTNWFSHEFPVLKKRSRDCAVLLKRDRQWMVEESARSALRKRWRAHQQIGKQADGIKEVAREPPATTQAHEVLPAAPPSEDVNDADKAIVDATE